MPLAALPAASPVLPAAAPADHGPALSPARRTLLALALCALTGAASPEPEPRPEAGPQPRPPLRAVGPRGQA